MAKLEEIAAEFHRARLAAELFDADWNLVWVSDELKTLLGETDEAALGYGTHALEARNNPLWSRISAEETQVEWSRSNLSFVLHETPDATLADLDLDPEVVSRFSAGVEPGRRPPPGLTSSSISGRASRQCASAGSPQLEPCDVAMNIGLHWGGALYMGQVVTGGRLEVTALGDEVNECARFQQSARDGAGYVSKALLELLTGADADAIGIDPDRVAYRTVAELAGATDKSIRDAGGIAVAELPGS